MNAREQEIFQQMLLALKAFQEAKAMHSYGDYAAIAWESSAGPYNKAWGGGDCTKHGRWYGRCHSCENDWKKLREQSDRDAVHARDNALRKADDLAKAAIAAAEASQAQQPPTVGRKFFIYGDDTGFDLFDSAEDAKKAAQDSIDEYRHEAGDGWPEEVERVCWGVVLGTTQQVALQDEYDGRDGWPTDDMVIRGAEQLHDSLRQFGCYHNFDADLNGTFVQQQVAESVFRAMLYAAQKPEGGE